ncbi:hypothetical protein [Agrobacterium tumefaciens]|uniref:hypothetical protein n=1 Tax=Agrobacterium tumefaciens TaxID=358 RepID=UPI0015737F4D|nr:hypothetical protein [Agrobacterium tumefaciens]NSX90152.1 hypothetical protein [Agrobacterium tumefaciens]
MIHRGEWETYIPAEIPYGMPANVLFWRRHSDGADLYAWSRLFYEFSDGADTSGTTKVVVVNGVVICLSADVSMLSLPPKFTLFEAEDGDVIPQLGWVLVDGTFQSPAVPDPVTVVYSVDLWSRMTDAEADQVGAEMEQQPFRIRRIFESAGSYRSDHELWPLLVQIATTLFGAERAGEILAPSSQ